MIVIVHDHLRHGGGVAVERYDGLWDGRRPPVDVPLHPASGDHGVLRAPRKGLDGLTAGIGHPVSRHHCAAREVRELK